MTLNKNWGYHAGDHNWKTPKDIAEMLRTVAAGGGNLLLNVGPKGDGSIPQETTICLDAVGKWLKTNGRAIFDSDRFEVNLQSRDHCRSDWTHHGGFSAKGNAFYLHILSWPGKELVITGLECDVVTITSLMTGEEQDFTQENGKLVVGDLPDTFDTSMPVVFEFVTTDSPCIYRTAGYYNPKVPHCRYDPMPSDMLS